MRKRTKLIILAVALASAGLIIYGVWLSGHLPT
jgi:hypothetical protein